MNWCVLGVRWAVIRLSILSSYSGMCRIDTAFPLHPLPQVFCAHLVVEIEWASRCSMVHSTLPDMRGQCCMCLVPRPHGNEAPVQLLVTYMYSKEKQVHNIYLNSENIPFLPLI